MSLKEKFVFNFIDDGRWHYIVDGLKVTLEVTFFAVLLGIALGVIIAIVRSTYDKNKSSMRGFSKFIVVLLNFICKIYSSVISFPDAKIVKKHRKSIALSIFSRKT